MDFFGSSSVTLPVVRQSLDIASGSEQVGTCLRETRQVMSSHFAQFTSTFALFSYILCCFLWTLPAMNIQEVGMWTLFYKYCFHMLILTQWIIYIIWRNEIFFFAIKLFQCLFYLFICQFSPFTKTTYEGFGDLFSSFHYCLAWF